MNLEEFEKVFDQLVADTNAHPKYQGFISDTEWETLRELVFYSEPELSPTLPPVISK